MEYQKILNHIDHTALEATVTLADIRRLCEEASRYGCASVCIPPSYVAEADAWRKAAGTALSICTVIGFPLGYQTTALKVIEATQAVNDGADEIDMVINLGMVKNGNWTSLTNELTAIRVATSGRILKVIIETCYLTEAEKIRLCGLVTEIKADYIKTSTGFGSAGATLADIELFKKHIGPAVKIKAAGGIRTREDMIAYLEAGCDRIGSSRGVALLTRPD